MNKIVIIGGSQSHVPFIKTAQKMGYYTIVFDRDEECIGSKYSDSYTKISTHDVNQIILKCKELNKRKELKGVMTFSSFTEPLIAVSKTCEVLGLPSFSTKSVKLSCNKMLMKECFIKHSVPTPKYIVAKKIDEAVDFVKNSKKQVILKPSSGSLGSKGVSLINPKSYWIKQFEYAVCMSSDKRVVLEEFYNGREFSVDGIVVGKKTIVLSISEKYNLGVKFNFTMCGFSMGKISDGDRVLKSKIKLILKNAVKAVNSMGITNSFFSVDVLLTDADVLILECGVLLDCKIDRLLNYVGVDVYRMILNIITGNTMAIHQPRYKKGYGLSFLFADKDGHLKTISQNKLDFEGMIEWNCLDEDIVKPPLSIADAVGWIIVSGDNSRKAYNYSNNLTKKNLFKVI